jgi:D-alanyl-D-alanine carboxypeptidase
MRLARTFRGLGLLAASAFFMAALPGVAAAQIGSERYSSVVMDPQTGERLFGSNADALRHPASLTKMMTLYMVFEALRTGQLTLDQRLYMTESAAAKPPSKLGLPPGRSLSVENGIYAVVTKSANDIATLFGETLGGGDEDRFAQMMTLRARAIGMTNTTFRNASGLPDIEQVTTAADMATLGRRLQQDYPERYHYFGTRSYQMGNISLRNHNHMLTDYEGVDGIKTGYINASGFNIVSSAKRENVRLIVAVFGGSSWIERDRHAAALLDRGFAQRGIGSYSSGLMAGNATGAAVAMAAAGTAVATRRMASPRLIGRAQAAEPTRVVAVVQRGPRQPGLMLNPERQMARATLSRGAPARATPVLRIAAKPVAVQPPAQRSARIRTVIEQGDGGGRVRAAPARPAASRAAPARPAQPASPRRPSR